MPNYRVTATRQVETLTEAGTPVIRYRVWFESPRGSTGHVDVDPEDWNAERLAEILDEEAEKLDLAFSLK